MNFTAEALLALLGMIGALLSINAHLLVSINGKVSRIATAHEVTEARTKEQIASLQRHQARNEEDTRRMLRHLRLPEQSHHLEQH